jgi:hypothetical protein
MKTKFLISAIAVLTLLFSCKKEETLSESSGAAQNVSSSRRNVELKQEYKLDDVLVSENEINKADTSLKLIVTIEEYLVTFNCFSTEKRCRDWIVRHRRSEELIKILQLGEHMSKYAEEIGAIEEYENTGLLMAQYRQYEENYLRENFSSNGGSRALGTWYTQPNGAGPSFPTVHWPAFGGQWNDNISSVMAIGGPTIYYDRTFYRSYMVAFWHLAPQNYFISFQGWWFDNKTSSALSM